MSPGISSSWALQFFHLTPHVCVCYKHWQNNNEIWNTLYEQYKDIEDVACRTQKETAVFILPQG